MCSNFIVLGVTVIVPFSELVVLSINAMGSYKSFYVTRRGQKRLESKPCDCPTR